VRRQTYGYLPNRRASPPLNRYQILTAWWQRHMCVNNLPKVVTWKRSGRDSNQPSFESQVQRSNHYGTTAMGLCLYLSLTSRRPSSIETANRSTCFWHGGFLSPILNCISRISKGTFLWNFVPNSGNEKFRHGRSIVLSTKLVDGRACWPHSRRSTHTGRTHIVYYVSVDMQ